MKYLAIFFVGVMIFFAFYNNYFNLGSSNKLSSNINYSITDSSTKDTLNIDVSKKEIDSLNKNRIVNDNRLNCPLTGEKTNDWFNCMVIEEMLLFENDSNTIDCSLPENKFVEKYVYEIHDFLGDPIISSKSYPSLNEYYFYSITTEIKNLGCTKLDVSNFIFIYSLYQDNILLNTKINDSYIDEIYDLYSSFDALNTSEKVLYPGDYLWINLGFSDDIYLPKPIKINNPNNFTFKTCLIDNSINMIISCDYLDFNLSN